MQTVRTEEPRLLRVFYVVLFFLIYRIIDFIVLALAAAQLILILFAGTPSRSLQRFGASLGIYVQQIVAYLSCNEMSKPYPFDDWPVVRSDD